MSEDAGQKATGDEVAGAAGADAAAPADADQVAVEGGEDASLAEERRMLEALAGKPPGERYRAYIKLTGPGWLQSAITLGGGSLAGSLYLGVLGGYSLLWLQPLAMIMGVVMLGTIAYVTLSTGKRPFRAIRDHVNPVLAWGWALATLMANIVWCLPQFALGTAAVQQNLIPSLNSGPGKVIICIALLLTAGVVVWFYDEGKKGVQIFERILKCMVGMIILCFVGVVIKMTLSGSSGLAWGSVVKGLLPNPALAFRPAASFDAALAATGEFSSFWANKIVGMQRDVMITAGATAVGINMTFLLPYSMLRKGWGKAHRELGIFDLAVGLFVPFMLATSCVVISAAAQFHARPQPGVIEGTAKAGLVAQYDKLLLQRVAAEGLAGEAEPEMVAEALPMADKRMAAMLVKRDAFALAASLENLTGRGFSHYIFGFGVLGMALSTIIILMLINGFTVCEMMGLESRGWPHRIGCYIAGLGVLGPFVWKGPAKFWLAVPTSVFGMALLPIAYITFFLMMNSKNLMGKDMLQGGKRAAWNALMLIALGLAGIGAGYAIWSKVRWIGVGVVAVFVILAVVVHVVRPPKPVAHEA